MDGAAHSKAQHSLEEARSAHKAALEWKWSNSRWQQSSQLRLELPRTSILSE